MKSETNFPGELPIGSPVAEIDTPSLVIDLDAMDRNLSRMATFAREHGVKLRPHAKMHKSAELARLQIRAGAVGVCVQKTSEAEALVRAPASVSDIFISNEVVGLQKLRRVAALARTLDQREGRLAIAVDSMMGINHLADAIFELDPKPAGQSWIDVFIEIDVGQGRCGVAPGAPAVALAKAVLGHPGLRFAGLQAYHGSAQHVRSADERRKVIENVMGDVKHTIAQLKSAGVRVDLVTGAGTGTFVFEATSGVYGEIQPGSYMFMDVDYSNNELIPGQPEFEQALFVKSKVISVSSTHAVCDAGHKSHAIDSGMPRVHAPDSNLTYSNGGDEHGKLTGAVLPAVGDTVWLIPGHCDPTVNLHDTMVGVRGGLADGTIEHYFRVDSRGCSR